jgi:ATP synthase protein I
MPASRTAADMTTESQQDPRRTGVTVLLGAAATSVLAGLLLAGAGALVEGSPAAYGALVGLALAVGVFLGGALVVDLVASVMPTASMLVALLTYTLEVVVMALAFVALSGSGLLDSTLSRGWLGAGVVVATLGWLAAQVLLTTRARIPAYDLPATGARQPSPDEGEVGAR